MGWLTQRPSVGLTYGRVVKKVDEAENNSTVLQDDDELVLAVSASKTYGFYLMLIVDATAAADFKSGFSVPAGATMLWYPVSATSAAALDQTDTHSLNGQGAGTPEINAFHGRLVVGGTSGNFQFQFAQTNAEVSDTKCLEGSFLVMWEESP